MEPQQMPRTGRKQQLSQFGQRNMDKIGWKAQEKMGICGATGCCQLSALSQLEAGR
jgi:hypothetical protein